MDLKLKETSVKQNEIYILIKDHYLQNKKKYFQN